MKTNRDAILQSALQLFMSMNYERVSLQMIAKTVGLTKTGIFNYYPTKLDLFIAVADKYLFNAQDPKYKFATSDRTLADFIEKYIEGVQRTMSMIVELGNIRHESMPGQSANAGYFHLFQQVLFYYPDGKRKLNETIQKEYTYWRSAIRHAIENGEINPNTNLDEAVALFRQLFVGLSYEMSLNQGLDTALLKRHFQYIYMLLRK